MMYICDIDYIVPFIYYTQKYINHSRSQIPLS